jgi:hypothetical protein
VPHVNTDQVACSLHADKDVLCEPPLACTVADARHIMEAREVTGRRLVIDMFSLPALVEHTQARACSMPSFAGVDLVLITEGPA